MPMTTFSPYEKDEAIQSDFKFDDTAFEVFFKENFTALCAFCHYKFGFDVDPAKEAVHTAFIRLWENRESLSAEKSIKAYMYKIVANICVDLLRHKKVKQQHEKHINENTDLVSADCTYESADYKEMKEDIDRAVLELHEQMRAVFVLSRFEGMKYMEIANQLGISVKTVETQMSRALVKLRLKLIHYLPIISITWLV